MSTSSNSGHISNSSSHSAAVSGVPTAAAVTESAAAITEAAAAAAIPFVFLKEVPTAAIVDLLLRRTALCQKGLEHNAKK